MSDGTLHVVSPGPVREFLEAGSLREALCEVARLAGAGRWGRSMAGTACSSIPPYILD